LANHLESRNTLTSNLMHDSDASQRAVLAAAADPRFTGRIAAQRADTPARRVYCGAVPVLLDEHPNYLSALFMKRISTHTSFHLDFNV